MVRLFLCCFRKDKKLGILIEKNMGAHQNRNTKTAIMFAVCLSFLIFAGSTFKLIGNLIVSGLESSVGADLYAISVNSRSNRAFIDEGPIAEFLENERANDGAVIGWTFCSNSMKYILQGVNTNRDDTTFSDMTGYKTVNTNLYSV